ncbi:hypothetical protein NicSoilC12_30460 [Arthrobacter sp. NicSoilC12]|nr:hypothetical protein NicSoilC12_30460 [Arthrobacter sp. NicSoilC12]
MLLLPRRRLRPRHGGGHTTRRTFGGQFTQRTRGEAARPADGGQRGLRRDQDKRRKRDNVFAISAGTAAIWLGLGASADRLRLKPDREEFAAAQEGLNSPSASASPTAAPTNSANIPKPETAAGKTFRASSS